MRFSEQLRQVAAEVWEAQHEHPFVGGIADGTLDGDRFCFYIRQDYLFLIDYGRSLALACARAPRLELMERFAALAQSTLRTEMELHRAYAAEWEVSLAQLEAEPPQAATRAYTDFLLRTAALGDFAELVAALACGATANSDSGSHDSHRRPSRAMRAGSRCTPGTSSQGWPAGVARSATRPPRASPRTANRG
jgi:thiaminase